MSARRSSFSFPPILCLPALIAACAAGPDAPSGLEPEAAGVTRFDAEPPVGATTWARPTWRVGDSFTLLRQGVFTGTFTVVAADDTGYRIDTGGDQVLLRDLDLGSVGSLATDGGEALLTRTPADARYHWPLWVGKSWQCEFVDRVSDGRELPTVASYEVEGLDTITVPAGTFDALRIVRRMQLRDGERRSPSQTHMIWYAPEEGLEVRQLLGHVLVELQAYERK